MALPEPVKTGLTPQEYFALDQQEGVLYDFWEGEVFALDAMAMTGGSVRHSLIASNALATLAAALRERPCRVLNSDVRLQLSPRGAYCHPDISVVCEPAPRHEQYIETPVLLAEVLSDATESYDRGLKFERYRRIPSLRAYLLLSQERPHGELFQREADGAWRLTEASGPDGVLTVDALGIALPLGELYRQVDFPDAAAP